MLAEFRADLSAARIRAVRRRDDCEVALFQLESELDDSTALRLRMPVRRVISWYSAPPRARRAAVRRRRAKSGR